LIAKISELEKILVDAVVHGFGNAVEPLRVVNPGIELCVDMIDYLQYVENGVLVPPLPRKKKTSML